MSNSSSSVRMPPHPFHALLHARWNLLLFACLSTLGGPAIEEEARRHGAAMAKSKELLSPPPLTTSGEGSAGDEGSAGRVIAAYNAIKEAIRSNVFPPGYQAAENEIARQLGMSRTPVHEAMARLQEDGLVRILPKKGIIICALSPADIEDIYEIIIALEGAAAA